MAEATEIMERIAARMAADILSRPRPTIKRSLVGIEIADIERRLRNLAAASRTSICPAMITRRDPDWEWRSTQMRALHGDLIRLRVQRAINEVTR